MGKGKLDKIVMLEQFAGQAMFGLVFYCFNNFITSKMDWVNPLVKVSNKFKFQLFGKQRDNLITLYIQVPKFDVNNSGGLSQHAFNLFLNAGGIFFTSQQIRTIKDNFPHTNGIAYRGFIDYVRNDLGQKRLATIDHTFEQFQQNGKVCINTILSHLAANKHPHVRSLSKKADKARQDIEEGFRYWSEDGSNLTHEEFREYFKDANACIPLERQDFFVDLLIHTFGLFENQVSNERLLQLEVTVQQKVRQRTYVKKDEGIRSNSDFKFIDLQDKGVVNFQRFVDVLDRIGCRFSDKECKALFFKHSQGSNILQYQDLCGLLFQMGSGTKDNKNPVFELAKSAQGSITTHGMTKKLH